jgi:hypothetical protein
MTVQHKSGQKKVKHKLIVWACPLPTCERVIVFKDADPDTREFLIVHHLVNRHAWTRTEVLNYNSELKQAAKEYLGFPTDRHGRVI